MTAIQPRAEAIAILKSVLEEKRTLDEAASNLPIEGDHADARFVMALALTTLRHLGQIDALLEKYVEKPLPAKRAAVRHALRLGVAQLLLLRTPPHAAVNETVEAIKRGKDAPLAGLVNAVLQRITRETPSLPEPIHNIPPWLRARWKSAYGEDAVTQMAGIAALRPPLDLYLPAPTTMGQGERLDDMIWRLPADHAPVAELPGYQEGKFWVQDIAASYPVRLLGEVKGQEVLDLAAAPGGKTMQLARAGAHVTAVDKAPSRMALLEENLARVKLAAETVVADILHWQPMKSYDAILLDAPCSATGTWRKHPEVLQLTSVAGVAELAKLQRALLHRALEWLKPGGRMVYCVCSLEHEEGEDQTKWFLENHPHIRLEVPPKSLPAAYIKEGMLRTLPSHLPEKGGMDGFFAVCFRKLA